MPSVWNRVRVRYENGLVVTANGASNVLTSGSWLLPELGWVAEGAGLTAGTTLREGVIADFADTGDTLFLNARAAADWNLSSYRRVHPSVASFQQTGRRAFRVSYRWDVQDRLANNYNCFVHFCAQGVIRSPTGSRDFTAHFAMAGWPDHQRRAVERHPARQPSRRRL